jgi:DNA-binding transcriptional regulator LsrR (DeoR family)
MLDSSEEHLARLAKMAHLYYIEGKNQEEVAEALGIARPMVSRQLKEAEEAGIVKVRVDYPFRSECLEHIFMERYGLAEPRIHIVDDSDTAIAKRLIGQAAARFLSEEAAGARKIAISWGSSLYEMVNSLEPKIDKGIEVVQLIGATGHEHNPNDGPIIARFLAEKLGARLYLLHAPLVVESELVAAALMKDKVVRETLDKAKVADIAFVGIGSLEREQNSLFHAGYISEEDLGRIKAAGGVGDTCAQFFDGEGRLLDIDINRRVIGLPPEDLVHVPRVIAVSLGEAKVQGILGALRGGWIKGLITDSHTAERVLELDDAAK